MAQNLSAFLTNRDEVNSKILDINITQEAIIEAMQSIKPSSSPGPDEIPAYIYNTFANELSYPAMKIWRISLDSCIMPEGILTSVIVPLYKGGDKTLAENYRPLALTNHLIKTFERVLKRN